MDKEILLSRIIDLTSQKIEKSIIENIFNEKKVKCLCLLLKHSSIARKWDIMGDEHRALRCLMRTNILLKKLDNDSKK